MTFHVMDSIEEATSLVDEIYNRRPDAPIITSSQMCQLLIIVAVASQYDDTVSLDFRDSCFESTRFMLDDAIEEAEGEEEGDWEEDERPTAGFRVMRVLTLMAVYQILEKRGSCWRYICMSLKVMSYA